MKPNLFALLYTNFLSHTRSKTKHLRNITNNNWILSTISSVFLSYRDKTGSTRDRPYNKVTISLWQHFHKRSSLLSFAALVELVCDGFLESLWVSSSYLNFLHIFLQWPTIIIHRKISRQILSQPVIQLKYKLYLQNCELWGKFHVFHFIFIYESAMNWKNCYA